MPISIDEFEERESPDRAETNAERVLRFLVEHRDKAFKASEIADATDVHQNSIQPVLTRLRGRNLVRHKEPFWATGDLDRVRDAYVFHSTTKFLDDELGEEDRDEWLAAASDVDEAGEPITDDVEPEAGSRQ